MKRLFSILLSTALLIASLVPAAAADAVNVSPEQSVTIELEDYYPTAMYLANTNASGGAVARLNDTQPDFIRVEGSEDYRNGTATENAGDQRRFKPIERTITVNAAEAGNYTIEWVANKNYNADSSPMTLAVNGEDVFRVLSNGTVDSTSSSAYRGQSISRDGRGNIIDDEVFLTQQSPCVSAGWSLTINGFAYEMQKYTATVALNAGANTISVYFCGGVNYTNYNLAMDYVKVTYSGESEEEEEEEEVIGIPVSAIEETKIELDSYFPASTVSSDANASGGSLIRISDVQKPFPENADMATGDDRRFTPVKRTITINAEAAGDYIIEWVANARFNPDSSAMTLAVNDTDVFDVIAQGNPQGGAYVGQLMTIDGKGQQVASLDVASVGEDAGYTVTVAGGAYSMKKYTATVSLNEGVNTIDIYMVCGLQWCGYNLAMDYVKLTPDIEYSVSFNLKNYSSRVKATAKILNHKEDLSDVNSIMLVTFLDENGGIVGWTSVPVLCENGTTQEVELSVDKNLSDDISAGDTSNPMTVYAAYLGESIPEIVSAKAFLFDCGQEALPTIFTATMKELAPMCEVSTLSE